MKFFPASWYASSLALLIFPLLAGCGTGGYDELVEAKLANLQSLAPFTTRVGNIKYDILFKEAEDLEKTGMTMYVPKSFDDKEMIELTIGGKDRFTKTLFEPKRVNPPFYAFPGFSKGLECFIETARGYKQPMYVYWATRKLGTIAGSKLRAEVAKGIGSGLSVKAPTWQVITVGAMGGKGLEVHRLQVAGKQDFSCLRNDRYAQESLDGRFDLYHLEGSEYHLLVGFRAPNVADEKTEFFTCAQVSMGTLQGEGIKFVDGANVSLPSNPEVASSNTTTGGSQTPAGANPTNPNPTTPTAPDFDQEAFLKKIDAKIAATSDTNLKTALERIRKMTASRQDKSIVLSGLQLSELPPELFEVTKWNSFSASGVGISSLPSDIGRLTNLKKISLGNNQLSSLPAEMANLTLLVRIELPGNRLSSFPPGIDKMSELQSFLISQNQLTAIPPAIGQLTKLQTFSAIQNQISSLPSEIGNCSSLTSLELSSNSLTLLPASICNISTLKKVNFEHNKLTALPQGFEKLSNLIELNIASNNFSTLPPSLRQLKNLTRLHLDENPLDESEVESLRQALPNCRISF